MVVDASVTVKRFVPEQLSAEARELLGPEDRLLAPDVRAELGNVLWKKHRRREIGQRTPPPRGFAGEHSVRQTLCMRLPS